MSTGPTDEYPTFAAWLLANRKRARFSLRELAREAGISHSYIANIEKQPASPQDMRPRPSQKVVAGIAGVLGADVDEALRLAGWLPASKHGSGESVTDRERQWIARYRSLPASRQKLIDRLIDELGSLPDGDDADA